MMLNKHFDLKYLEKKTLLFLFL